jgi:alkylhydroperoxidase/carboxymuconolactone decarboxylase family protein YurZ
MPHIALPANLPGITSGFAFRPETARPMRELAEVLLHLDGDYSTVDAVTTRPDDAPVSPKLKALIAVAAKVRESGRAVRPADVDRARDAGATDLEIHDTVLIAAAFCMFNRYVDGLATMTPSDDRLYDQMGQRMARDGYVGATARADTPVT